MRLFCRDVATMNIPIAATIKEPSSFLPYKIKGFEIVGGSQEKSKSRDLLFSIQSEGLACNLTAGEYVIAEGVWHHASACISPSDWLHSTLRVDSIQGFALIPYRRQAADFIHAYRRDYIESYVEALDFQGLLCFWGNNHIIVYSCIFRAKSRLLFWTVGRNTAVRRSHFASRILPKS